MDATSILPIIIVIVVVYFLVKLIISPLIRVVAGIVIFFVIIFVLQNFFNIDFTQILGPLGKYLDFKAWNINLGGIINLIGQYINQSLSFLRNLIGNAPNSSL